MKKMKNKKWNELLKSCDDLSSTKNKNNLVMSNKLDLWKLKKSLIKQIVRMIIAITKKAQQASV